MSGKFGFKYVIQTNANGVTTRLSKNDLYMPPIHVIRSTTVSTAGNATYATAALAGGMIVRTPAGNVTDTLPTAAALIAVLPNAFVGMTLRVIIRNTTAFTVTLEASASILIPYAIAISPYRTMECMLIVSSITSGAESISCLSLM